jgi:hypothetical protein
MSMPERDESSLFNSSVSAPSEVLMQELPDGEAVFLDLRTESYLGLDSVGTKMYRVLLATRTVEDAYEELKSAFAVEPDRLRRDMRYFVERLVNQGLLQLSE